MLVWPRSLRREATSKFIPNRNRNGLGLTGSVYKVTESYPQRVAERVVTSDIQWVTGASSLLPTVFIRDTSIQPRIHTAAFDCTAKLQRNFTHWCASGLQ